MSGKVGDLPRGKVLTEGGLTSVFFCGSIVIVDRSAWCRVIGLTQASKVDQPTGFITNKI